MVEACHDRGMQVLVYLGALFSEDSPHFPACLAEFAATADSSPYSHYAYPLNVPPKKTQVVYGTCPHGAWADHIVAKSARLMDQFDVDGFYLDSVGMGGRCHSVAHGCEGRHLPNGGMSGNLTIIDGRNLIRRLYQVVKSRKPDGQIDLHPAACWCSANMAWATSVWDGETILGDQVDPATRKSLDRPLLDYLSMAHFRAEFMGKPWGVPVEFLDYRLPQPYRDQFAICLLHDVPIRPHLSVEKLDTISEIWHIFDAFGRTEAEWLPYWKNSGYVSINPAGAYASLYRHPANGALAVVSNLSNQRETVRVSLNLEQLGLQAESKAFNALTEEPVALRQGNILLELDPIDWRLVWLEP
jgi:hypothetical protein